MSDMYDRAKLRALFIVSADEAFSDRHPLWATIESQRAFLDEMHVAVFVKRKVSWEDRLIHKDEQLSVYQIRERFLWWNIPYVWTNLEFNLRWQNAFRPDYVLSFADGIPALIGFLLAWQNKKKFFMQGSSHLLGQSKASLRFLINRFLMKRATAVLVPGKQTAMLFSNAFSIPPAQLLPIDPPFDIQNLGRSIEKFDFHAEHPQYNFFISSVVYTMKDVYALMAIHAIVRTKYARVALIILVDKSLHGSVDRLLKRSKAFGAFAYEQNDKLVTYINGTHLYLAVSKEQDIDTMMVTALGLQMPVVTRAYGIAPELFKGTPYEHFMVADEGVQAIAAAVVELIEHQQQRIEYGLNTGMQLSRVTFTSTVQYGGILYKTIEEIVRPALQPMHEIADLAPFVPEPVPAPVAEPSPTLAKPEEQV